MKNTMKAWAKIILIVAGVIFIAETQAEYQIIDRFQLLEDKFRTQEMLRPFEHDFILDITALANTDVLDFVDEAEGVADFQGTDEEKLAKAQTVLRKYDKTEQNVRLGLNFGIPLFSFTAFGVKIKPSIRGQANLGFLMGIQTATLTVSQAFNYLGNDIPVEIRNKLNNCVGSFTPGATVASRDIVLFMLNNAAICGLSVAEQAYLSQPEFQNKYIFPADTTVPDIFNYVKGEARVGLNFDYIYDEHFFGTFSLYGLGRADYQVRVAADALINSNSDVGELPDELNTTINAAFDYRFGYRNGNLMGFVSVEDVKIARMSDQEEEAGTLAYGEDPLIRLHGEYLYKYSLFSVKPFAGTHKRSSYGFGDGFYAGADLGAHVWEDRVGLRMRAMIDGEHVTFSPMMKLWLVHVEYMLKQPVKSDVDGVKPATIHSLNFRIAI